LLLWKQRINQGFVGKGVNMLEILCMKMGKMGPVETFKSGGGGEIKENVGGGCI
jgi:hypothetical protein